MKHDELILPGKIIISRASGGQIDATPIHIEIEDGPSRTRVLDIYMALDEFCKALFSSYGQCTIRHFPEAPIGKIAENKEEIVPYKWASGRDNLPAQNKALAPFEIDGWVGYRNDLTNPHRSAGQDKQRVTFHRYVEAK